MEKFFENIENAEKNLRSIDHIVYVTFPLIKDKRLLLKVMHETRGILINCITAILQYEYMHKRINLSQNSQENFKVFTDKCSINYGINRHEIGLIIELFDFVEKHKMSPFEFVKGDKIIMLSESLKPTTITLDKIKEFLILAKEVLKKTKGGIKGHLTG